jgi:hypothetical protein
LSCTEIIDTSNLNHEPSLIFYSLINPEDSISLVLSESVSPFDLDNQFYQPIGDADISLFENGILIGKMNEIKTNNRSLGTYWIDHHPVSQGVYSFEIETQQFGISKVSDAIPSNSTQISIDRIERFLNPNFTQNPENGIRFDLIIEDNDEGNYYDVGASYQYDLTTKSKSGEDSTYRAGEVLNMTSKSLLFDEYSNRFLLSDGLFNGKQVSIPFEAHFSNLPNLSSLESNINLIVIIEFREVSQSYYEYYKSVDIQNYLSPNPFSDNVQVYSNVYNGLGVLASYSIKKLTFQVE